MFSGGRIQPDPSGGCRTWGPSELEGLATMGHEGMMVGLGTSRRVPSSRALDEPCGRCNLLL